jgi:hypothetical protein
VGRFTTAAVLRGGEVAMLGGFQATNDRAHKPSTLSTVGGVGRVPMAKTPATVGSGQKTTPIAV